MVDAPTLQLRGAHAVIFGGAGFIGTHLAEALVEAGAASVVSADIARPTRPLPSSVRQEYSDVREPIEFEPGGPNPLVFNLAAVHRTPGHADAHYFETNVAGALNVATFCDRYSVDSLWFTSSIAVYGPSEDPCTEDLTPRPASAYGQSKLQAEAIHHRWANADRGRRLVIARPATVFGPGEAGNFTRLASALRRRRFFYPGRKDTIKACGYIDELIQTMMFMWAAAEPTVVYNFTYPDPPTIEDICSAFAEVGGLPMPAGVVPARLLLLLACVLSAVGLETFDPERVKKLILSTNIKPSELVRCGYQYETDLRSAIARWHTATPRGKFV
jgi:nucleoside-diphosphate-sugar epimerase